MAYRFLILNASGRTSHLEEWSCASDTQAVERASRNVPSYGAELWRGGHRLSGFAGPLDLRRAEPKPCPHA